uniref:Uncharacterized protein n=1 Tax=Anguilla anguilla TaxID=7936 RepID=A0A0E9UDE8_ANGAN
MIPCKCKMSNLCNFIHGVAAQTSTIVDLYDYFL